MTIVIVPEVLRDAINAALDAAFIECPEAELDRENLFMILLDYFYENGRLPEFSIRKRESLCNSL